MSNQEKRIYATIISTFLVFGLYGVKMIDMYQEGLFDGADATSLLGKSILLLIVANVVVNIILQNVFNRVFVVVTKICESPFSDERDKLIVLKGMQISYVVFGGGFLLSMSALALGWSSFVVLHLIIIGIIAGEVIGGLTKLYYYRKGF